MGARLFPTVSQPENCTSHHVQLVLRSNVPTQRFRAATSSSVRVSGGSWGVGNVQQESIPLSENALLSAIQLPLA